MGSSFIPSSIDPYNMYDENLAYLYTKEVLLDVASAGDALKHIKRSHFGVTTLDEMDIYRQQLIFNLFGDPSMYLV